MVVIDNLSPEFTNKKVLCSDERGGRKDLINVFSGDSALLTEWIAKRVYMGEFSGSRSVGRRRKRWIDTLKNCLKKMWISGKRREWCMIGVNGGGL